MRQVIVINMELICMLYDFNANAIPEKYKCLVIDAFCTTLTFFKFTGRCDRNQSAHIMQRKLQANTDHAFSL